MSGRKLTQRRKHKKNTSPENWLIAAQKQKWGPLIRAEARQKEVDKMLREQAERRAAMAPLPSFSVATSRRGPGSRGSLLGAFTRPLDVELRTAAAAAGATPKRVSGVDVNTGELVSVAAGEGLSRGKSFVPRVSRAENLDLARAAAAIAMAKNDEKIDDTLRKLYHNMEGGRRRLTRRKRKTMKRKVIRGGGCDKCA